MEDLDGKAEKLADEPARLAFWHRTESFLADNQDRFQSANGGSWDPTSGVAPSVAFLLSEIQKRIKRIESLPQTPIGRAYFLAEQQIRDAANRVSLESVPRIGSEVGTSRNARVEKRPKRGSPAVLKKALTQEHHNEIIAEYERRIEDDLEKYRPKSGALVSDLMKADVAEALHRPESTVGDHIRRHLREQGKKLPLQNGS